MYPEDVDDVDILFARLEPAALPANLQSRVLAAAAQRSRRRHAIGYSLLAASIILGVVLSFSIGQQLRLSGALALFELLADAELVAEAPGDVALAVAELVPWHLILLVVGSLALVAVAARLALSPSIRFMSRAIGR